MKKYIIAVSSILAFVVILFGIKSMYETLSNKLSNESNQAKEDTIKQTEELEEKNYAIDFQFVNQEDDIETLSSFIGKPIVINFWASWCGPCKSEMSEFQRAFEVYGDGVVFLIVNLTDGMRETKASAQKFIDKEGYTFPIYFDVDNEGMFAYQVWSLPTTYFINAEGQIITYINGMLNYKTLADGIERIK